MKTTELYCNSHNVRVEGEFVHYSAVDIPEEYLAEFVGRTSILEDFNTTLKELNETHPQIELNVVVAPDRSVSASLSIDGASYRVPITYDESGRWVAAIFTNVRDNEKPLAQRLLDGGYPIEDMFFHNQEGKMYVYNNLLSTQIIDKWCADNGFDKEQRCAPYRGTITGRPMYVCKLWESEKTKDSKIGKKRIKKRKSDNYER